MYSSTTGFIVLYFILKPGCPYIPGIQVAPVVKNPPANAGDIKRRRFNPLDWEDPLEEGTATHSSILAWRIPWTEEPGGLQCMGWQESPTAEQLNNHNNF